MTESAPTIVPDNLRRRIVHGWAFRGDLSSADRDAIRRFLETGDVDDLPDDGYRRIAEGVLERVTPPPRRAALPDLLTFRVWWLDWRGERYDSCVIRRRDLTTAINRARTLMTREADAHGLFVCPGVLADGEELTP